MSDGRRAPAAGKPDHGDADDDPDELGVFAAERYFYGDDALWCGRSSSSLSSAFRTGTGTIEHDRSVPTPTAATSSSEASWNSRSALLPNEPPPADKLRTFASGAADALAVEAEPPSGAESERTGRRRASSTSSNNMRRWLLGVAGCACARGDGDGEESVSADEMEASGDVLGACGEKCNSDARRLSPRTELILEPAFEEAAAVTVRPGSGRWLLDGYRVLAGRDAFSPIEIAGHGHRRSANLVEMSTPAVLHPAAEVVARLRWVGGSRETIRAAALPSCRHATSRFGTEPSAHSAPLHHTAPAAVASGHRRPQPTSPPGCNSGGSPRSVRNEDNGSLGSAS